MYLRIPDDDSLLLPGWLTDSIQNEAIWEHVKASKFSDAQKKMALSAHSKVNNAPVTTRPDLIYLG